MNTRVRFPELDLLRFIAACGVMLFHFTFRGPQDHICRGTFPMLGLFFQYGYLGVDLFFILSGFVILLTAYEKDAIAFTIARIVRLYPAYWLCVTLTTLALVFARPALHSVTLKEYLANLTMAHSYFGVRDVSGVYWTLAVELKFYFLIFLVLAGHQTKRISSLLGMWLLASIGLSLYGHGGPARFFLFPEWSSYFIAGAMFFLIHREGPSIYKLAVTAGCYLLSVGYATHFLPLGQLGPKEGATLILTMSIAVFYLLFLGIALRPRIPTKADRFYLLGLITYPLYLIHQDIGYIFLRAAPAWLNRYVLLLLVIGLVIALSFAIHLGEEKWLATRLKNVLLKLRATLCRVRKPFGQSVTSGAPQIPVPRKPLSVKTPSAISTSTHQPAGASPMQDKTLQASVISTHKGTCLPNRPQHPDVTMCGIIGYVGKRAAAPILLDGLRRLEYRGYDSAGVALLHQGRMEVRKKKGKIEEGLAQLLQHQPLSGRIGVGHTRWATHGPPSDENSHPHLDHSGTIAVVHNGVIENCDPLRDKLLQSGHTFRSGTDTEILAHLIGDHYENRTAANGSERPLALAVCKALREVEGTYGIAVLSSKHPGTIIGARRGSPLIVGLGDGENLLASDASALVAHTRRVIYLNDCDVVTLTDEGYHVLELLGETTASLRISQLDFTPEAAEKGDYQHYMLKEIFEQPVSIRNVLCGRIDHDSAISHFGGLNLSTDELRAIERVVIAACGTSWHAGLVGEYLIEELAHLPTEVEYASEFRYRNAPFDKNTLVLVITQSGETLDTLAALRETKRRGHKALAICNVVGSTIAREADGGIYLHAGPEIGVASTKAFTSQIAALTLFALLMGRIRTLTNRRATELLRALEAIPDQLQFVFEQNDRIRKLALKYRAADAFLFLGRQYSFPVALEGALKVKELSYAHAEGYPAAEMKHGPIALVDPHTPSVFVAPLDAIYEKTQSNIEEIKARGGPIIAVTTEGNHALAEKTEGLIYVPKTLDPLTPLLTVVPLQLFAYHMAVARSCDVDKPRNLAKSVTVE